MAESNGGAYISSREIYALLVEVRDDVLILKKEAWLNAETNQRRDKEIAGLKSRWYGTLGVFGGFLASLIAIVWKG